MKSLLVLLFVLSFSSVAFSQISKNQWLIGGSGSILTQKYSNPDDYGGTGLGITLSPGIGYFPVNNLAAGVRTFIGYDHSKGKYATGEEGFKQTSWHTQVGPFIHYYFLPTARKMNLLADASYYFGMIHTNNSLGKSKSPVHGYAFSMGPVWFLNSTTALELTLHYSKDHTPVNTSGLAINVGLQIHLGKAKGS